MTEIKIKQEIVEKVESNGKTKYCLSECEQEDLELCILDNAPRYTRFSWCDLHGIARGVTVPTRNAKSFLKHGYKAFAGSIAFGPQSEVCVEIFEDLIKKHEVEDCVFVPAVTRPYTLSWLDCKQKTQEVLCNAVWQDGSPYLAFPRNLLCQQVQKLADMGFVLKSAFEFEFCVLNKDTMTPIAKEMHYASCQHMNSEAKWLYELEEHLEVNGIEVRTILAEYSAGQYEITFVPEDAMKTADDLYIFKQAIKEVARQNDKVVSFMPRIFRDGACNSFHFNHSLWNTKGTENLFWDASVSENKMSDVARYWLGGILKHFYALTSLSCPTPNCYRRLHTPVVPSRPNWSIDDRHMAMRVVNSDHDSMRMENRMPSSACNPYLVTAACIAAGIDGIENKIEPPPVGPNKDAPELPHNLQQALRKLRQDDVIVEALGEEFIDMFITLKKSIECKKFDDHNVKKFTEEEVCLERKEYLEII